MNTVALLITTSAERMLKLNYFGRERQYEGTEAVLGGLGCEVNALKAGSTPDREKRRRPSAWLAQ